MWWLFAKLHQWSFQLALWIIKLPFQAGAVFFKTVLAWLHMEVRRWVGILVGGLLVLVAAQTIIRRSPPGSSWRLVALLMVLVWLVALFSAARYTMEYLSLRRVRQRREFVQISQGIAEVRQRTAGLPGQIRDEIAKATAGSAAGRVFASNRDAQARRQAEEHRRAVEAAEREELVAAMNAEHDPFQ